MNHTLEYLKVIYRRIEIEGPINGLYCLFTSKDRIVLWNPALIDYKILPLQHPHFLPHYKYKTSGGNIGFGFDLLTNDKVVLLRHFFNSASDYPVYEDPVATLYNLTINTWRHLDLGDIQFVDYLMNINRTNLFINGTYHWCCSSFKSVLVFAFDMGNETFLMIPGPDISKFDGVVYLSTTMALYEECVVLIHCNKLSVNIWVMFEEGIWIKQFSIGPLPGLFRSLGFWKNECIFLVINDSEYNFFDSSARLVLYDVNTQEMKSVGPTASAYSFRTCLSRKSNNPWRGISER